MVWLAKLVSGRVGLVIASLCISALWTLWMQDRAYDRGVRDEKMRQLAALSKTFGDMRKRHEQELKTRGWQDESEAKTDREERAHLNMRIAGLMNLPPRVLIQTKEVINETGCSCPAVTLSNDFWLQYRSAGTRSGETDPAAADAVSDQVR